MGQVLSGYESLRGGEVERDPSDLLFGGDAATLKAIIKQGTDSVVESPEIRNVLLENQIVADTAKIKLADFVQDVFAKNVSFTSKQRGFVLDEENMKNPQSRKVLETQIRKAAQIEAMEFFKRPTAIRELQMCCSALPGDQSLTTIIFGKPEKPKRSSAKVGVSFNENPVFYSDTTTLERPILQSRNIPNVTTVTRFTVQPYEENFTTFNAPIKPQIRATSNTVLPVQSPSPSLAFILPTVLASTSEAMSTPSEVPKPLRSSTTQTLYQPALPILSRSVQPNDNRTFLTRVYQDVVYPPFQPVTTPMDVLPIQRNPVLPVQRAETTLNPQKLTEIQRVSVTQPNDLGGLLGPVQTYQTRLGTIEAPAICSIQ